MESTQKQGMAALRRVQVEARTGKSRSKLYADIAEGKFPAPIQLGEGGRSVGWLEHEVDAYIAARIAARDSGPR